MWRLGRSQQRGVARATRNAIIAPGRHGAPDGKSVVADVSDALRLENALKNPIPRSRIPDAT